MEMQLINLKQPVTATTGTEYHAPFYPDEQKAINKSFIEANTIESSLPEIQNEHIIPVFIKDNEPVISSAEFIRSMQEVAKDFFHGEEILEPEIRLSHPIKGRVPEARNKPARELLEHEKTLYYERMAFVIEIPSVSNSVNGQKLSLTVGGVKAYNLDNLNTKSGVDQNFKIFCGFQNKVCTNMCVSSDGFVGDLKVKDTQQLNDNIKQLFGQYDGLYHLKEMESFTAYSLTEQEFALLIGRCRMYKHLPEQEKDSIPPLLFGDNQINTVCKDYFKDDHFSRNFNGSLNLWNMYNLLTGANKSTYIDSFLDRSLNAYTFTRELKNAIKNKTNCWFLS